MCPVGLKHLPASWQRALFAIAIALAIGMVMCTNGLAAPRADSGEECQVYADMAVVARAMAEDKAKRAQTDRVMERIYQPQGKAAEVMRLVTDAAYRDEGGECLCDAPSPDLFRHARQYG